MKHSPDEIPKFETKRLPSVATPSVGLRTQQDPTVKLERAEGELDRLIGHYESWLIELAKDKIQVPNLEVEIANDKKAAARIAKALEKNPTDKRLNDNAKSAEERTLQNLSKLERLAVKIPEREQDLAEKKMEIQNVKDQIIQLREEVKQHLGNHSSEKGRKSPIAPKKVEQVQQVRSEPKSQAPSPWAEQKTQSQPQTQPLKTYSADTSEGIIVKRPDTSATNIPLADLKFNEGLAVFEDVSTGLKGYVDGNGKVVIKPQFTGAGGFYQERAVVKNTQEEWGYIDKLGNWVISPKFCSAARFSEGLAGVYVGGVRDENGDCVQGKWGFISVTGKMVIAPQFDKIWRFEKTKNSSAKAKVVLDGYTGYINSKGEWVD